MATIERLQAASDAHTAQRRSIVELLLRALIGLWAGFTRWDDEDAVVGMAARSATMAEASAARVRRLQRSYLRTVLADLDVQPNFPEMIAAYPRANIGATDVYMRPVEQFIWARRNGGTAAETKEAFEERLRAIAEDDMRAAERDEADRVYRATPKIIGHRRIIHPERSKTGTCGLCVVAATRFYTTDDLLPLHDRCECDTAPITADDDPGLNLNRRDLEEIYAAAGSTAAEDLKNTRVTVREHGELGPILVREGQSFRSARDAGAKPWSKPTNETMRRDRLAELDSLNDRAARAQRRLDEMQTTTVTDEQLVLQRSLRYMRERAASIEAFLNTLPQ